MPAYDAFLSYSHAASQLGMALERTLEELGKPWDERRILTVYRDTSKQGLSSALGPDLLAALDGSRFLVLLAAPEAARSSWVRLEVEHWIKSKGVERLLLVLVGGELVWDFERAQFDPLKTTALPAALFGAHSLEPKWLDLRWADGHGGLNAAHERFADCVAELSAAIRGIPKDLIVGAQLRQYRKGVSRRVAQQGLTLGRRHADLALLLGAAALELDENVDTKRALSSLLEISSDLAVLWPGGRVTALELVEGRGLVLIGTRDGALELWDADAALQRAQWHLAPGREVTALASSQDGTLVAAALSDGQVVVRSLQGEAVASFLSGPAPVRLALAPALRRVATASPRPGGPGLEIRLHELPSGRALPLKAPCEVSGLHGLVFDPAGRALWLMTSHETITIDLDTGTERSRNDVPWFPMPGPKACTSDGRLVAMTPYGGGEGTYEISLYDPHTSCMTNDDRVLAEGFTGVCDGVGISSTGDTLAVVSQARLKVIDSTGQQPTRLCNGMPSGEVAVSVARAGRIVCVRGTASTQVRLPWRTSRLGTLLLEPTALPQVVSGVVDAAFSTDGHYLAWVALPADMYREDARRDGSVRREPVMIWNTRQQQHVGGIACSTAYQLAFEDCSTLIVLDLDGVVSAWDLQALSRTATGFTLESRLLSGARVRLWQAADQEVVLFVGRDDGTAMLYRAMATKPEILWEWKSPAEQAVLSLAHSSGTRFALVHRNGVVSVVDTAGAVLFSTRVERPYSAKIAISPDGRYLATAGADGSLFVHDIDVGTLVASPVVDGLEHAAFSHDSSTLFVLTDDRLIVCYELTTGLISTTFQAAHAAARLQAAPTGDLLAEIGLGGGCTLWNLDTAAWRDMARRIAGRQLSPSEKARYGLV